MAYINQFTSQYKTFLKRGVVEALTISLANHPDPTVARAKVATDYTEDDFRLPAIIIKYNEQRLPNAGVGHYEWLVSPDDPNPLAPSVYVQYQHRLYQGTIEFEIFGMSSADRDIISDALIEVLAMDEVSAPGQAFLNRFYNQMADAPFGQWHLATLNVDQIEPLGEQFMLAPWNPEDQAVYQTSYRVVVFGEFYSYTPPSPKGYGPIAEVDVYAWPSEDGITPLDPSEPPPPVPKDAYTKYKGFIPGQRTVPTRPGSQQPRTVGD